MHVSISHQLDQDEVARRLRDLLTKIKDSGVKDYVEDWSGYMVTCRYGVPSGLGTTLDIQVQFFFPKSRVDVSVSVSGLTSPLVRLFREDLEGSISGSFKFYLA